jgi:hypothetical protein
MKHSVDSLMALADKFAEKSFEQGLGHTKKYPEAEREALLAALTEALAHPIDTSQERVEKSGEIKQIGCVQHDCAECKARAAQPVASNEQHSNSVASKNQAEVIDKVAQPVREPDLSALMPKSQSLIRKWLADGTFVERAIGTMREQERELLTREPLVPCRCFDDTARNYCKDKNRCTNIVAQGTGGFS